MGGPPSSGGRSVQASLSRGLLSYKPASVQGRGLEERTLEGPQVCILAGRNFEHRESMELVELIGRQLESGCGRQCYFMTRGVPGLRSRPRQSSPRRWTLVEDSASWKKERPGRGAQVEQQMYITIEGGQGVAQDVVAALTHGAYVVPVRCTGRASAGGDEFPKEAMQCPDFVPADLWDLLSDDGASVKQLAYAVVDIVLAFLRHCGHPSAGASPVSLRRGGPELSKSVTFAAEDKEFAAGGATSAVRHLAWLEDAHANSTLLASVSDLAVDTMLAASSHGEDFDSEWRSLRSGRGSLDACVQRRSPIGSRRFERKKK